MPETDLKKLKLGQVPVNNEAFGLDVKINEGYNAYSAELLRLALLVITGLSIVWLKVYLPDDPAKFARVAGKPTVPPATGWLFMLAFVSAALSAGAALIHRYTSVDSLACHLRAVRLRIRNRPERTERAPSENQERKRPGGEWLSRLGRWFAAVPDTTSSNSDPSDLALAQEQERQRYARFTWSARLLRLSAWLLLFGLLFFCLSLAIFMINAPGVLDHKGPGLTNETSIDEPGTAW